MSVSSLFSGFFFSFLNFTLITVNNTFHSQNVSSNRNETLTVTCSHSAETVEFCYGFELLRLAFRFQNFSSRYRVNATPKTVRISFRFQTLPASCERCVQKLTLYISVEAVVLCRASSLQLTLYQHLTSSRWFKSCLSSSHASSLHLICIAALKKLCNHPCLLYRKTREEQTGNQMTDAVSRPKAGFHSGK